MPSHTILPATQKEKAISWAKSHREEKLRKNTPMTRIKSSVLSFGSAIIALSNKLTQGSDSYVRLGQNLETNTPVALKVEFTKNTPYASELTFLENEAEILKLLNPDRTPPELLTISRSEKSSKPLGKKRYLLMDLFSGETLHHSASAVRSWSFEDKKTLMINLLKELQKLHSNKIAHCDLHSGNIMLNLQTKQVKIFDFGRSISEVKDSKIFEFLQLLNQFSNMQPREVFQKIRLEPDSRFFDQAIITEHHFKEKSRALSIPYQEGDYRSILNTLAFIMKRESNIEELIRNNRNVEILAKYSSVFFNKDFLPFAQRAIFSLFTTRHRFLRKSGLYAADAYSLWIELQENLFNSTESYKLRHALDKLRMGNIEDALAQLENPEVTNIAPTATALKKPISYAATAVSSATARPLLNYSGIYPILQTPTLLHSPQPLVLHYPILQHPLLLQCRVLPHPVQHQGSMLMRPVF